MWAIITGLGMVLLFQSAPLQVRYGATDGVPTIQPIEAEVCAGGVVHFPNVVFVEGGSAVSVSFADAWCLAGLEGSCVSVVPRADMPLLEAKAIRTDRSTLNVPATLKPGVWHYQHVATMSNGTATAYIVKPVVVVDCP
jgi:hypothetical protein